MITLELTEQEAADLRVYLGMHHTKSAYDTFPVYEKLADAMDSDLTPREQASLALNDFVRGQKIRQNMTIDGDGLVFISERA